jgi:hypothetical protein
VGATWSHGTFKGAISIWICAEGEISFLAAIIFFSEATFLGSLCHHVCKCREGGICFLNHVDLYSLEEVLYDLIQDNYA